ncbi:MAG: ABC transporter permease subunit [Spirochaetaceae bacterium]|jgi:putative aldouronate transport system permease protein|nr:ABC transporter permease subunit [Spirochaetaceae bacterium]
MKRNLDGKMLIGHFSREWQLYVLILFPMLFVFLFKFGPMFGLVIAFKDYKIARGFWGSQWAGFAVFKDIFRHRDFIPSLRNTLVLNLLDLIMGFPMPIVLALILNEIRVKWIKRVSQTLLYLPHFLSWVIIGGIALQLFSGTFGVVNNMIELFGKERVPFLTEKYHWLGSYVLIGVWQTMGWGTILYLAAISGVNPELYEAAIVDGAGRLRQCISITLPCIRSTIVILLIMNLGKIMGGSFERIYALQNAMVLDFSTTIPVLVYRWGIQSSNFSRATALGFFQSVIGLILVLISDKIAKKLGEDGLL